MHNWDTRAPNSALSVVQGYSDVLIIVEETFLAIYYIFFSNCKIQKEWFELWTKLDN